MVEGLLWKIVQDRLKNGLQYSFAVGLGSVGLVVLSQHDCPDMEIKQIKIWKIRRSLIFIDKIWTMLFKSVLRQTWSVPRHTVLLEDEVVSRQSVAASISLGNRIVSVLIISTKLHWRHLCDLFIGRKLFLYHKIY